MSEAQSILLVEDSRTQAIWLTDLLETEGWQVHWAPTAEAAMEKLSQNEINLVILDYHLPGIRGDELCRRIRMNVDTRDIPILMLTMEETHDVEAHGLESGADDFVPKSVDADILLIRIRTLLAKSCSRSTIPAQADVPIRGARLLSIDGSQTYQDYLATEMETEGYQFSTAHSGSEGLERLAREQIDCVLLDLAMPDLEGADLFRRINDTRQTMDNPTMVLVLTEHETKEELTRAFEAGVDDFVGKSSDVAVLKSRLRALLRRKFTQEENRRILEKLKINEHEILRVRAEKEVAEATAALLEELEMTNGALRRSNEALGLTRRAAEAAERATNDFLASLRDEIRAPTNAIVEVTELALDTDLAPGKRDCLAKIRSSADELMKVSNRITDFSRINASKVELD